MGVIRQQRLFQYHQALAQTSQQYQSMDSISTYGLEHAAYHYACLNDGESLWELSQSDDYQQQQVQRGKGFTWTFDTFRFSIAHYVHRHGDSIQSDVRLSTIVLKSSRVAEEAVQSVNVAFEWFQKDSAEIETVLSRIEVLDEQNYFNACLLLILSEALRQGNAPVDNRHEEIPQKILDKMDSRISNVSQVVNVYSLSLSMVRWLRVVLSTWKEIDLSPVYRRCTSVDLFTTLINLSVLLIAQGEDEQGNDIFKYALEILQKISDQIVKSNVVVDLFEVAKLLVKIGKISQAQMVFTETIAIANMISHAEPARKVVENDMKAMINIEEILHIAKTTSDDPHRCRLLSEAAIELVNVGDIQRALDTVHMMNDAFGKSFILSTITISLANKGDVKTTLTVLDMIDDELIQSTTLSRIVYIFKTNANVYQGPNRDADGYYIYRSTILESIFNSLESDDETLIDYSNKPSVFWTINDPIDIQEYIENLKVGYGVNKGLTRACSLNEITKTIAQYGAIQKALGIADGIEGFRRCTAFTEIAKILASTENLQQAFTVVDRIDSPIDRSKALADIVHYLIDIGDVQKALATANSLTDGWYKSKALTYIARDFAKAGDIQTANTLFEQALVATEILVADSKFIAFRRVIVALAQTVDIQRALTIVNMRCDDYTKSKIVTDIASTLGTAGDIQTANTLFEQALVATEILDDGWKLKAIAYVARSIAEIGDVQKALVVANTINDWECRTYVLNEIDDVISETRQLEKVLLSTETLNIHGYSPQKLLDVGLELISKGKTNILHRALVEHPQSMLFHEDFLSTYQNLLTDSRYLRISFLYAPFSSKCGELSILNFINHHLRYGNEHCAYEIIRQCPELDLDVLLPESE